MQNFGGQLKCRLQFKHVYSIICISEEERWGKRHAPFAYWQGFPKEISCNRYAAQVCM